MPEEQIMFTIRTLDCDICKRYDTIILTEEEVIAKTNATDLGIGAFYLNHDDHKRVVYFDNTGKYLGDTIVLTKEELPDNIIVEQAIKN